MIVKKWWESYPLKLKSELMALEDAGLKYTKDEKAISEGIFCLIVETEGSGKLRVVFPDLYPYFRFEIYAPDIQLHRHQNPFDKNLCLIGRSTEWWHTDDTVASFILERLPQVLKSGQSNDLQEVATLEEHQAEPFSDYYPYHYPASVIVDGGWTIDKRYESGTLLIGVDSSEAQFPRVAVLEVRDESGNILEESDARLKQLFSIGRFSAKWVRLSEPPNITNPSTLFVHLLKKDPNSKQIESYPVSEGRFQIRAGIFPEENNNWRRLNNGWIFACRFEPDESWRQNRRRGTKKEKHRRKKK